MASVIFLAGGMPAGLALGANKGPVWLMRRAKLPVTSRKASVPFWWVVCKKALLAGTMMLVGRSAFSCR